jgi:hypothetical protein
MRVMKTPLRVVLSLGLAAALAAACASSNPTKTEMGTAQVRVQKDPQANFSAWKTYSWFPLAGEAGERSTAGSRIIANVDRILGEKGYTRVQEEQPDFKVACITGLNEGWTGVPIGYLYPYYWSPIYNPKEYGKGFIALDLVDGKTNALSWRGNFSRAFTDHALANETLLTSAIDDAIARILKDFPARATP